MSLEKIMGFHIQSCAGLPPGTMMASSVNTDGKIHIAVRTEHGRFAEKSFTPEQMAEIIDRASLDFWDKIRGQI